MGWPFLCIGLLIKTRFSLIHITIMLIISCDFHFFYGILMYESEPREERALTSPRLARVIFKE